MLIISILRFHGTNLILFPAITIPGKVPGGIYSDLNNAGVISDILRGFNDVLTRWVAHDTWTYEGRFNGI